MLTIFIIILLVSITTIGFAVYGCKSLDGLTPKTMYRVAGCLVVASILSGSISLAAISLALSSPPHEISSLDAYVDILGVLVTVLMGWNIISVVDFKRRAEKMDNITEDFQHVILGILRLNIKSFMMIGKKHQLLDNCLSSLDEIKKCKDDDISKLAINEIMLLLYKLCDEIKKDKEAYVYNDKRDEYNYILDHIENAYSKRVKDIIEATKGCDIELSSGLNLYNPSESGQNMKIKVEGEALVIEGSKAEE